MTQLNNVQKDTHLLRQIADLQQRVDVLEDILATGKEVLTVEEAAKFMGMARSTLYKMTSEQTIPFYRPNGKLIYFEKSELLGWMRKNRSMSEEEANLKAREVLQSMARN